MSSPRQIELFRRLTEDRQFPPNTDVSNLRQQFGELTDRNASGWIEKALELPKKAEGDSGPDVPAPF